MIRALIVLSLFASPLPVGAIAQAYIATQIGKPCPPNSVVVTLQDGRRVCAVAATLTPLKSTVRKDSVGDTK
jgi:hypothetical protein